jgi:hypothetical protein
MAYGLWPGSKLAFRYQLFVAESQTENDPFFLSLVPALLQKIGDGVGMKNSNKNSSGLSIHS